MNWISIFNVKLDILGLRAVSVVDDVCKSVGINVSDVDPKDQLIYDNLQNLRTPHGLFQIEAETNCRVCQKVKPKNLEELSAVLALARPGALDFVDQYAAYVEDGTYDPIHPFFDDILTSTGGVALYQEQLMKMANKIGFTLDEAEILRRIVGKKKVKEVRKWKKKIKEKVKENNLDPEISDILWKVLQDSANYSFNKSHSISYAALAATTIYLKFKYPQQFFLSLLKMTRH
jgi:DNA polymerase-3 subunit alpha